MQIVELQIPSISVTTLAGALEKVQVPTFSDAAVEKYKRRQLLNVVRQHSLFDFILASWFSWIYRLLNYDSLMVPKWRTCSHVEYRLFGQPPNRVTSLVKQIRELRPQAEFRVHWLYEDPFLEVIDEQDSAIIYGWNGDNELVEIDGNIVEMRMLK